MVRKTNYGQLQHALGPQSVLSEDNVAYIHENALRVVQDNTQCIVVNMGDIISA